MLRMASLFFGPIALSPSITAVSTERLCTPIRRWKLVEAQNTGTSSMFRSSRQEMRKQVLYENTPEIPPRPACLSATTISRLLFSHDVTFCDITGCVVLSTASPTSRRILDHEIPDGHRHRCSNTSHYNLTDGGRQYANKYQAIQAPSRKRTCSHCHFALTDMVSGFKKS